MNTNALVRRAAAKGGLTQEATRCAPDALVDTITEELHRGSDVHIARLGMLRVREYAPTVKYLPARGQTPEKGVTGERERQTVGGRRTVRLYPATAVLRTLLPEYTPEPRRIHKR